MPHGGRAPVADGLVIDALAFVLGPLGGGMVPQLAAPSPFLRAWRAGCGSLCGVVRWWHRSLYWHGSDGDGVRWVPDGALARLVARGARFHSIELVAHLALQLRGRLYNGRG